MGYFFIMEYIEDTRAYFSEDYKQRILFELFGNAYRTIMSVYIFKHFEEYVKQLHSDKNEEKKEEYWNASYYEKLIDYIKISVAFENFNKAILLRDGYLVHKIQKNEQNKILAKLQRQGIPIKVDDFLAVCPFISDKFNRKCYLSGLTDNFQTIKFSDTLNENYQALLNIDSALLLHIKKINDNRNRLHFFTDFKGAFEVNRHIQKWQFIKDKSVELIKTEFLKHN
jgi:hypothetical protein